jgi:3-hydroxyacyl-[acyl-carrier-protein] dehydratase
MNTDCSSLYGALSSSCLAWRIEARADLRIRASADFRFGGDFPGFQGHFPGKPILPAIVQLAAVRYVAESALQRDLLPASYNKMKFKGMIRPNDRCMVVVDLTGDGSLWRGGFSLTRPDGEAIAAGSVEFFEIKKDVGLERE